MSCNGLVILISGGFKSTLQNVLPRFERVSGVRASVVPGPSMGDTPEAIPNRLARNERADVLVMVGYSLDALLAKGLARRGTKVDLARSPIGVVTRRGARKPDVSTSDKLRDALLAAASVAYSDSASGRYVSGELFEKLGVVDAMRDRARKIPGTPVAEIVAQGKAEIGLQEVSEILPVEGAELAGRLPPEINLLTPYAAAVAVDSRHPADAGALIRFLADPAVLPVLERDGLEPPGR